MVRCEDYDAASVRRAVAEALRLAELEEVLTRGAKVLLKPNLLSARPPDDAVTTHPAVIQSLGEVCLQNGCEVSVGDSPPFAGENPERYARHCRATGVSEVAGTLGVPLVRFEDHADALPHPGGRFYRSFDVARSVLDADVIVNIPKFKTHGLTGFTGAIKNIFGCVPGIRKGLFHVQAAEDREVFAQMLVDLYGALSPRVNLMDAVVAMEGEGPNVGEPRRLGIILASSDGVALDATACAIAGVDPFLLATTRLAHEQGIGCGDLDGIEIRGERIESVRVDDFKQSSGSNDWLRVPSPIRRMLRRQLVASPRVSARECVGCGDCATACPVQAISPGTPVSIDLDRCIRCYCCQEVCNSHAVELKRGWIGEMAFRLRKKR